MKTKNMTILHFGTSTVRSPLRLGFLLIPLGLACFAVLPITTAADDSNTKLGKDALKANRTGTNDTALGYQAMRSNTTASHNTGVGYKALFTNNTNDNTAVGWSALAASTGTQGGGEGGNTAVGSQALLNNASGVGNTAIGWFPLLNNTDGSNNTAVGAAALAGNTGSSNTALGTNAGNALTTGVNNIDIGDSVVGMADESNTIRIGGSQTACLIAGISGTAVVGDTVVVDANGQLGTATSSARFKKEIKPMDKTSEAILALKPVSFQYKSDSKGTPQFGLIAEEVVKVNPALVVRDRKGEIYSVRYDAVNAMLLNEFLKEHRKNQEQEQTIAELKSGMTALATTVKEQAAQIQKVSAQLEASKPTPQVVNNP